MTMICRRRYFFIFILMFISFASGCMTFTQRDYELQEKAYQRDREDKAVQDKERLGWRW